MADSVEAVGVDAAGSTEGKHQGAVEEVFADHHIGEEAEDGAVGVGSVGVPSSGEARVEVETVQHEVGVGVDLHDVETVFLAIDKW